MRGAGHIVHMGEMRNVYKNLVGKFELRRPLGGPTCRWEGNMKMDLMEVRLGGCRLGLFD
jgi:hypothetical protein